MASVSILYIDDLVVGPHLELLRRVCEPQSTAKPHVTVRFFERLPVPDDYFTARVDHIDVIAPGAYGISKSSSGKSVVFLRCRSDVLAPLEHKPHFPTSEFHITVYEGTSRGFARRLLSLLRSYKWAIRVPLSPGSRLKTIPVKSKAHRTPRRTSTYSHDLELLFLAIMGRPISLEYLSELGIESRLSVCKAICEHLQKSTAALQQLQLPFVPPTDQGRGESTVKVHLTPPELALEIARHSVGLLGATSQPIHFGDPSIGTGAFFAAITQAVPVGRISSAIGVDISPKQVDAAKWRWADKGLQVMKGDYLHMDLLPKRNLILANPPYLRHQAIPQKDKLALCSKASTRMGMPVSARSGQYVYFMLLSHDWMLPGAIAAWLIPSEFMQTGYGAALRRYLTSSVELLRVHQYGFDTPQFETAKVLPCVVIFRNSQPARSHTAVFTSGGSISKPAYSDHLLVSELASSNRWSVFSNRPKMTSPAAVTVGDIFTIRRGVATGANDYFVMARKRAHSLGIPESALRPVLPKVRSLKSDVVESARDGYPAMDPQLSMLDVDLPESVINQRFPRLATYLSTAEERGVLQRYLVRKRRRWYRQEPREVAEFLCTYMGRGRNGSPPIRFIWNKSSAVATNTYLMLYPKPKLLELLSKRPKYKLKLFELLKATSRENIRAFSRVHAGGLRKIEPSDLNAVPLAFVPSWLVSGLENDLQMEPGKARRRGRASKLGN